MLDLHLGLGLGSEVQPEARMLKRQTTLRLNPGAEAKWVWVWRSIPLGDQQQIVELWARMIGRAARPPAAARGRERNNDDEHGQR